ncbi:uncharacterized protein LOC135697332 [Ochlerotatus camptorhynchus]|uniref:uncharacterized protein LOC135697332 n=1 Tax=Ochlerotatus camptorhynchus TaxID=644619 RepID=UPI0031D2D75D
MEKDDLVSGLKTNECGVNETCECCCKRKSSRTPFPKESKSSSKASLDIVHTDDHKAYRFLDKATWKIYISRDATFVEVGLEKSIENLQEESTVEYHSTLKPTVADMPDYEDDGGEEEEDDGGGDGYDTAVESEPDDDNDADQSSQFIESDGDINMNIEPPTELRRSTRVTMGILPKCYSEVTSVTSTTANEPRSYTDAIQCPDAEAWHFVMKEELQSLLDSQTWELVPP